MTILLFLAGDNSGKGDPRNLIWGLALLVIASLILKGKGKR